MIGKSLKYIFKEIVSFLTAEGHRIHIFLLDLLAKRAEDLIRWKDKHANVFEIVDPDLIAEVWAAKKGNRIVSYDNFTRAIS